MSSLNEVKFQALTDQGYTAGTLNEREYAWLAAQTGLSGISLNEQWMSLLGTAGYTGTLNERQIASWVALGYTGTWGELAYQFWSGGGTYLSSPDDLAVTGQTSSTVSLAWTSDGADYWKVQYSTDQAIWTDDGNAIGATYTVIDLTPETLYYFRIISVFGTSEAPPSNVDSATTNAESAFDLLVAASNPVLWYDFQDSSFSSLLDQSGNNYTATKINAGEAVAVAPLRSTKTQAASFPYAAGSATNVACYQAGSGGGLPASAVYNQTNGVVQFTLKRSTPRDVTNQILGGVTGFDVSPTGLLLAAVNTADGIYGYEAHTTGTLLKVRATSISNNNPHIVCMYCSTEHNSGCLIIDGVQYDNFSYIKTITNWAYPYMVNPRWNTTADMDEWTTDHQAFWAGGAGAVPSVAEIIAMQNAYLAEVV